MGICGAQCLFSPFWCSGSLFQKPSRGNRHWETDCSGCTLPKANDKSKWNILQNCQVVYKTQTRILKCIHLMTSKRCSNRYRCFCVEFSPVCSLCFRAIYFTAYSKSKETLNGVFVPNSGVVHMSSAGLAGEQSAVKCMQSRVLHKCFCLCFVYLMNDITECLHIIIEYLKKHSRLQKVNKVVTSQVYLTSVFCVQMLKLLLCAFIYSSNLCFELHRGDEVNISLNCIVELNVLLYPPVLSFHNKLSDEPHLDG